VSYPTRPDGGPVTPVVVVESDIVQGNIAIPVYGYASPPTDKSVIGMPAIPVKVITDADLVQNGGTYYIEGRPYAMPVFTPVSDTPIVGQIPIAVYPVNSGDWPNPDDGSFLLLESGDYILLETGDKILLESQ